MKNKLFILSLIAILLSGCSSKQLKVMTWNIWHGGIHGDKASGFHVDTANNTLNIQKVIEYETPDILFMQETYCCGMEICKNAGYEYSWRASSNLSIHSKYPIIDTFIMPDPFRAGGVTIDVNGDKFLCFNIWIYQLPDYIEDAKTFTVDSLILGENSTRVKEIKIILKNIDSIAKIKKMPIIVGGDFNSASHLDWIESTKDIHYNKVVEWPVSKIMLEHGFIDSYRQANPDPAKDIGGTWGYYSEDIITDRIDYIYYKGENLKVNSSKVVKDDPPNGIFNSDHRGILTIFDL